MVSLMYCVLYFNSKIMIVLSCKSPCGFAEYRTNWFVLLMPLPHLGWTKNITVRELLLLLLLLILTVIVVIVLVIILSIIRVTSSSK